MCSRARRPTLKTNTNKLTLIKQSADLCTNPFGQYVAYEYIKGGYLDRQLEKTRKLYRRKRDVMLEAIEKYFPENIRWTIPRGGMFLWVTFPKRINTRAMFKRAVGKKVAYVVGDAFFPDGSGHNTMRLNFSYSDDDMLTEGVRRLAEAIKEEMSSSYFDESIMAELI